MDGYRQFWNRLIYFNQHLGPESLERYWITLAVFAVICLALGVVSTGRLRLVAPAATIVIALAYIVAIVPFMAWAASCTSCGSSISAGTSRSSELYYLHANWGGVFSTGVATLWIGVVLSRGVGAMIERRTPQPPPPPEPEPAPAEVEP